MSGFDESYYKTGNYEDYLQRSCRYVMIASEIIDSLEEPLLDFGCGVGFLVRALQSLNKDIQGYDVSQWAINYGTECLKIKNLTSEIRGIECKTLIALDVFEHMTIKDIQSHLQFLTPEKLVLRIPVAGSIGEDFVLQVSRNDRTHITRLTKVQWESLLSANGYNLQKIICGNSIFDSEGVLSRVYVKSS